MASTHTDPPTVESGVDVPAPANTPAAAAAAVSSPTPSVPVLGTERRLATVRRIKGKREIKGADNIEVGVGGCGEGEEREWE